MPVIDQYTRKPVICKQRTLVIEMSSTSGFTPDEVMELVCGEVGSSQLRKEDCLGYSHLQNVGSGSEYCVLDPNRFPKSRR